MVMIHNFLIVLEHQQCDNNNKIVYKREKCEKKRTLNGVVFKSTVRNKLLSDDDNACNFVKVEC